MKDCGILLFGKKIGLSESGCVPAGEKFGGGGCDHGLMMEHKICFEDERVFREDAEKAQTASSCTEADTLFIPHDPPNEMNSEAKPENSCSEMLIVEPNSNPKTVSGDKQGKTPNTVNETDPQPKTLKRPEKILPCPRCESMDTKFCYYNNCNINQPRHFCRSCQRYWTAGGTMRNMPIGAGRRKKKNPAPIEVAAVSDGVHNSVSQRENGEDCTSGSTVTTSNSVAEKTQDKSELFPQGLSIPWFYSPWSSAIPICPPGYPLMPICPSPYWNCVPLLPIQNQRTQPPSQDSSILGKHSRDEQQMKHTNSVLIPKTLRIDDPDEAARSSIWETLGIKNESLTRGGLFKAFEAKKHPVMTSSLALQANPAALSRSLCFQEGA